MNPTEDFSWDISIIDEVQTVRIKFSSDKLHPIRVYISDRPIYVDCGEMILPNFLYHLVVILISMNAMEKDVCTH